MRIGVKIMGFFFENENMLERSRKIIKEFTPDNLEILELKENKSMEEIKNVCYIYTNIIFQIFGLSKMETTKFLNLFPKCEIQNILNFLSPKIRNDLHCTEIEEEKELSNVNF